MMFGWAGKENPLLALGNPLLALRPVHRPELQGGGAGVGGCGLGVGTRVSGCHGDRQQDRGGLGSCTT